MDRMDRRKFVFAALCGAGAGLALAPFGAEALTLDAGAAGRIADPLTRTSSASRSGRSPGRVVAAGSAGGVAAAAFAAGAGCDGEQEASP